MSLCFLSYLYLSDSIISVLPSKSFSNIFYFFNSVLRMWQVLAVTLFNPSSNIAVSLMSSLAHYYLVSLQRWLVMTGCLPKATCFIFNKLSLLQDSFSNLCVISLNKYLLTTYCVPDTVLETRNTETRTQCSYPLQWLTVELRTCWLGFCLLNHTGDSNFLYLRTVILSPLTHVS